MTDDLSKYELIATILSRGSSRGEQEVAKAIDELIAMVRDERIESDHYADLAIVDLGANPTVSWKERAEAAEAENKKLRAALGEVVGCFDAAYFEGLAERLVEHDDTEPGSLADLVKRRLLFAQEAAHTALGEEQEYARKLLGGREDG
jgi:hypothetical protein